MSGAAIARAVPAPATGLRLDTGAFLFSDLAADLVRDPSRRTSSRSCRGEFMSLTTSRRLVFESAGERDLLMIPDGDYRTVELTTQPERFRVHNGRRWTTHVPDVFAASLHGERCFLQVKPGAPSGADGPQASTDLVIPLAARWDFIQLLPLQPDRILIPVGTES